VGFFVAKATTVYGEEVILLDAPVEASVSAEMVELGLLQVKTPHQVLFPDMVVSTSTYRVKADLGAEKDKLSVRDHRKTSPGWSLTATGSDLKNNEGDLTIPVMNMGIEPVGVNGQDVVGFELGKARNFTGENDRILVVMARPGYGGGDTEINANVYLDVPANEPADKYTGKLVFTVQ